MTVPAVDALAADVVGVAELDRLLDVGVGARHEVRSHQQHQQPAEQGDRGQYEENTGAGDGVRTTRKDLTHTTGHSAPEPARACRTGAKFLAEWSSTTPPSRHAASAAPTLAGS